MNKNGSKGKEVKNATVLETGDSFTLCPAVNVGKSKPVGDQTWVMPNETTANGKVAADVTYSVNKKGIVRIVGNTVYRVADGSVTITVKTTDGKSYKLKIDDASKAYVEPAPAE